jgi:hypothetical protein
MLLKGDNAMHSIECRVRISHSEAMPVSHSKQRVVVSASLLKLLLWRLVLRVALANEVSCKRT